jgi:hypothetical protein
MNTLSKFADAGYVVGLPAMETAASRLAQTVSTERTLTKLLVRDRRGARVTAAPSFPQAIVRVLERLSSGKALVYWSDVSMCHYGNQDWREMVATTGGVCALSGRLIRRGDSVYRPSQRKPKPKNAAAMILSSAMPDYEEIEVDLPG